MGRHGKPEEYETDIIAQVVSEEPPTEEEYVLLADWLKDHPQMRVDHFVPMFRGMDPEQEPVEEPTGSTWVKPPPPAPRFNWWLFAMSAAGLGLACAALILALWLYLNAGEICQPTYRLR